MDNPHDLQSWPDFEAAARKADALWLNLNMDERQAIKDNVSMPPDVAVNLMQKALHKICSGVIFWGVDTPRVDRNALMEFRFHEEHLLHRGYIYDFGGQIETISGSIIKDIVLAVADYYEKHVAPTIR